MKSFNIRIGVDNLNLKVKFSCKISISLKYRGKQYSVVDEQPLVNGNFNAPIKEITNLEADYNQKEDRFADNQSFSIILYLHSTHGKLLVGSFLYKLSELKAKKSIVEKIRNSPDKNAEIKLTLEIIKNKSKKQTAPQKEENLVTKYSTQRQQRLTTLRSFGSQEQPLNSPSPKNDSKDYQKLLRSFSGGSNFNFRTSNTAKIQEKVTSPSNLLRSKAVSISPEVLPKPNNLVQSFANRFNTSKAQNHTNVQLLKRKLSQVKQNTVQGNQKHLERIAQLERQLKQSKQKASNLQLEMKLKESNAKYFEKDLSAKKDKIESLEAQNKELNKKIINNEQKIRELQYNFKNLVEEHTQLLHVHQGLTKKSQKREEYYKDMIENLNQRYYQIQKQKENARYKIERLQSQIEENNKIFNNELKQKDKRYTDQRSNLTKKIAFLQKNLEEKKNQNQNLTQKLKVSQKQTQQLKNNQEKIMSDATKLKNKIEELTLSIGKEEIQKKALQQQLKQQKITSQENKTLKQQLQQKNEQLQLSIKKIGKMEEQIAQNEQKIKQLETNVQNLEEQYERLYYQSIGDKQQLQRKKRMIADLTQQNQQMEKNIQKLNFTLKNQANQFEQQRTELHENYKNLKIQSDKNTISLKQAKKELIQQSERRKISQKQLLDSKKRIDDLQNQVENLETRLSNLLQEINKLKGSNVILTNRNENLASQIEEIKKMRDDKEAKVVRLSEQNEELIKTKEAQVQAMQQQIQRLNADISRLNKQNQQMNEIIDSKKDQINQLKREFSIKRTQEISLNQAKIQLQKNNARCRQNLIQLHEKVQKLQQMIISLHQGNQEIDTLLFQQQKDYKRIAQDQSEMNLQLRKKKINDLFNEIQKKYNQVEQKDAIISNLQLQISHLKDQQIHLKEYISAKEQEIAKVNQSQQELKKYFDQNLTGLKDQLNKKETQIFAVSLFKFQNDIRVQQSQNTIYSYKQLMKDLNDKVAGIMQQKNKLQETISENEKEKFKLKNQISKLKTVEKNHEQQIEKLKTVTKEMIDEIESLNEQKSALTDKINEFSVKNIQKSHKIAQYEQQIANLKQKNHLNQKIIDQQTIQHEKQQNLIENIQAQMAENIKDLNKKLQATKIELTEKAKQLAQVQSQKKNRIQILSNNLDQLKKENSDLHSVAYAQKSNNTKLNSIISELSSSINKIEKAHNIKTYYMIPIKDLLKKFQQIMEASDKMYTQLEKKKAKKQQKQKGTHMSKSSYEFAEI